jgi:hypothetical protein
MDIFLIFVHVSVNLTWQRGFVFPLAAGNAQPQPQLPTFVIHNAAGKSTSLYHLSFPLVPNFTIFIWEHENKSVHIKSHYSNRQNVVGR